MIPVRNRHHDIIPISTLRCHSDMNLQPEENQCDIRFQYHFQCRLPDISERYRNDIGVMSICDVECVISG